MILLNGIQKNLEHAAAKKVYTILAILSRAWDNDWLADVKKEYNIQNPCVMSRTGIMFYKLCVLRKLNEKNFLN